MSFLLDCPNCGKRPVTEFLFRGEYKRRPSQDEPVETWAGYIFMVQNLPGPQIEWWQHRSGCQRWFLVRRNTTDDTDHESFWFEASDDHLGT